MRSPSTSASFADFIFCIFFDVGFDCLSFLVHWVQVGFLRPQYHSVILNFVFIFYSKTGCDLEPGLL